MTEAQGPTVLIVENDPGVAARQRFRLEQAGYAVLDAATTEDALAQFGRCEIDLVLLADRLPSSFDGLAFHTRLQQAGHDVPVVLVTRLPESLDYWPEAVEGVLQQVRTQRRLAESQAHLTALVDSARDAIVIAEADQRISLFNRSAEVMFRCSAAAALGQRLSRFLPSENETPLEVLPPSAGLGKRGVRADGEEFPVEASVARNRTGSRTFYTVVIRDLTERVRAEEELRASDARYRKLIETAGVAILSLAADGTIREWNGVAEQLFGWSRHEVLGCNYFEYCLPAEARAQALSDVRGVLAGAAIKGHEAPVLTRGGGRRIVLWNLTPGVNQDGRTTEIIAIGVDVTLQRSLEEQYRQARKMEAVGRLASGVAHDFNNLLTVITGYSEVLLTQLEPGQKSQEPLEEIHRASERATALTRQLMTFSRKSVLQPQVLNLNVLVAEMEKLLRRLIGEHIQLIIVEAANLARVKVDPGQMEQVILNLCINARDAMPGGGRLTIQTGNTDAKETYMAEAMGFWPPGHVLLAVSDTGCGMSEEVKARIFEPFFTTKEPGKGTGLGLATVYGIIEQSGGRIAVHSEPGRGSRFHVFLPCTKEAGPSAPTVPEWAEVPRGTETLLLAEDDAGVRGLALIALQSQGYTVLEARDGQEALEVWQQHGKGIDLLVTDVVMPRMGGKQLVEVLTDSCPDLRVLYLSGYSEDVVLKYDVPTAATPASEGRAFLAKPFTATALVRKVREVLDQPGPRTASL